MSRDLGMTAKRSLRPPPFSRAQPAPASRPATITTRPMRFMIPPPIYNSQWTIYKAPFCKLSIVNCELVSSLVPHQNLVQDDDHDHHQPHNQAIVEGRAR